MKPRTTLLALALVLGAGACADTESRGGSDRAVAPTPPLSADRTTDPDVDRDAIHARMFAEVDTDHDGTLSAAELQATTSPHGRMLRDHVAEVDTDRDGAVSRDELAAAIARHHGGHPPGTPEEMRARHARLFAELDTDGDGKLTAAELEGAPAPASMLADHLADVDTDGDGAVTMAELDAAIARFHGPH